MTPMRDLGWHNAGGEIAKEIDRVLNLCRNRGHERTAIDLSDHRGTDHQVTCIRCDYVYHYDSGD